MDETSQSLRAPILLPLEIQEMIVDNLHDDKGTLKSCALVCKRWLPASRLHLFRTLEYKDELSPKHDLFLEFLLGAAHIAPYVRKITLAGEILAETLLALMRTLHNLECVVLLTIIVKGRTADSDWIGEFLAALMSLQELVELRISGWVGRERELPILPPPEPASFKKLCHLDTTFMEEAAVRVWENVARAKTEPDAAPLRELGISVYFGDEDGSTVQGLHDLLSVVGKDVRRLTISFDFYNNEMPFSDIEQELDMIDFSVCTHVHIIEIHVELFIGATYRRLFWSTLVSLVSRVPSTALNHLVLVVQTRGLKAYTIDDAACRLSLEQLDLVLCQLPKLNDISVRLSDEAGIVVFNWMIGCMPNIAKKGVAIEYSIG